MSQEPIDPPLGLTLNERNQEIYSSAMALEEVLKKHNLTFWDFACTFFNKNGTFTVGMAICVWQKHDDKCASLKGALEKLNEDEKVILQEYFHRKES